MRVRVDVGRVPVRVRVGVGVREAVRVGVAVRVVVGVAVGDWQNMDAVAVPTLPPPDTNKSRVPKRPLVLIFVEAPARSWNELLAMGVPFKFRVQVPGLVMDVPMLVITNVPTAAGVQSADIEKTGVDACAKTGN